MSLTQITTGGVDENIDIDSNTLKVDGTNNRVGIGTASPSAALEVAQTSDMAVFASTTGTNNSARFEVRSGSGTTSGKYAYVRFNNNDTNNQRYDIGTYGTDNLTFRDVKAGSTRMTLDTSGNFGIGTALPSGNVHIADSTKTNLILKKTGLNNVASGALHSSYDVIQLGAGGSFASYNVETVTSDTYIGHNFYRHSSGTHKYKYSDAAARIRFNSTQGNIIFDRAVSGTANTDITFSESMRIDSSGVIQSYKYHRWMRSDGVTGCGFVGRGDQVISGGSNADLGISTGGGNLVFGSGGTSEKARIDTSGTLGIGTSTPSSYAETRGIAIRGANRAGLPTYVGQDGSDTTGFINMFADSSNGFRRFLDIGAVGSTADGTGKETHIRFITQGTSGNAEERARFDSGGRLTIGRSNALNVNALINTYRSSGSNFVQVQSDALDGQTCIYIARARRSGGTYSQTELGLYKHGSITEATGYLRLPNVATARFYWTDGSNNFRCSNNPNHIGLTSGTVVGTQTSDLRLKNVGASVSYGLAEVKQLQPKQYALKSDPDVNKLGFIAQEVESIIPEAVFDTREELDEHQEGDRTKLGMEYVQLIPVLVNAIKELSAEVDILKTKVAALEAAS